MSVTLRLLFVTLLFPFTGAVTALPRDNISTFHLQAFGVQDSLLVVDVEEHILVPSLAHVALSQDELDQLVPYPATDEGQALTRELLAHDELSLGDSRLYFCLAVHHAFDRIFQNSFLGQGSSLKVSRRKGPDSGRRGGTCKPP